jgi:hypothetical protein
MDNQEQTVGLPVEHVKTMFDLIVHSLDFGSGFLDYEDVLVLRAVAEKIGVDPIVATPMDLARKTFPHHYEERVAGGLAMGYCERCREPEDNPIHTTTTT